MFITGEKSLQLDIWDTHTKEQDITELVLPTPTASDGMRLQISIMSLKKSTNQRKFSGCKKQIKPNLIEHLAHHYECKPTINFYEVLMGFPIKWTQIQ